MSGLVKNIKNTFREILLNIKLYSFKFDFIFLIFLFKFLMKRDKNSKPYFSGSVYIYKISSNVILLNYAKITFI